MSTGARSWLVVAILGGVALALMVYAYRSEVEVTPPGTEPPLESTVPEDGGASVQKPSAGHDGQRDEPLEQPPKRPQVPPRKEGSACHVVEEGGRPVAGAGVTVYREGSISWEGKTDPAGVVLLDGTGRPELIVVTADGFVSVAYRPQDPPPYRITLRQGGTISGRVVDVTSGSGLDDFGIVLQRTDVLTASLPFGPDRPDGTVRKEVFTDAQGHFEARGLSPSASYEILDGGQDLTHALIPQPETHAVPVGREGVLLRAAPFRLLRVHLFDLATTRPAGGVGVEISQPEPGSERQRTVLLKTTDQGIADFSRRCFAGTCVLKIHHPDYREVRRELPEGVDEVEQWLEPESFPDRPRLEGWAEGAEAAVVWQRTGDGLVPDSRPRLRRGQRGAYTLEFLEAGQYVVVLTSLDGELVSPMEVVRLDTGEVVHRDFFLEEAGAVEIRDVPAPMEVWLNVAAEWVRLSFAAGLRMENGDAIIPGDGSKDGQAAGSRWTLRPGSYEIEFRQPDGAQDRRRIKVEPGKVTVVEP